MKDREAWHSAAHGITKSSTQISSWTTTTNEGKIHFAWNSMSLFAGPRDTNLARLHSEEWTFLFSTQVGAIQESLKMGNMDSVESFLIRFSSVQSSCSGFQLDSSLCPTLCNPVYCSTPGFPVHHQLPEFTQTHVHWVGDAIQPSHPLSSPFPPALNLSQHQGLLNESVLLIRWSKYWSCSFNISPSNEYSGLISFRVDWLDLLAVQGTLKSLLQHHCSKASILWCFWIFDAFAAFFIV